jgi:hypothetical protein
MASNAEPMEALMSAEHEVGHAHSDEVEGYEEWLVDA